MTHRFRFVAPALTALAALAIAACSDRSATAPEQSVELVASNAAAPATVRTTTLSMTIRELGTQTLIGGTTVAFKSGVDGIPVNVEDNAAADADKRSGYFAVTLTRSSSYQATVIASLSKYDRLNATKQITSTLADVSLGTLYMWVNPLFTINVRKASNSLLLGGATYTVGYADGTPPFMQRKDNVDDMSITLGVIRFYGKSARTHQICEITAPAGYLIPTPSCKSVYGFWTQSVSVDFLH